MLLCIVNERLAAVLCTHVFVSQNAVEQRRQIPHAWLTTVQSHRSVTYLQLRFRSTNDARSINAYLQPTFEWSIYSLFPVYVKRSNMSCRHVLSGPVKTKTSQLLATSEVSTGQPGVLATSGRCHFPKFHIKIHS